VRVLLTNKDVVIPLDVSPGHHHEAAEGTVRLPAGRGQPVRSRHSGRCQRVSLAELNKIQKHVHLLNTRYSVVDPDPAQDGEFLSVRNFENLVHTQKKIICSFQFKNFV
jgi:hypothetical protein